jgi:hypothetical protein
MESGTDFPLVVLLMQVRLALMCMALAPNEAAG